MQVLNEQRSADYFISLADGIEDSAVTVIRGAWLMHSSSVRRLEHLEPMSPLDMLVLYQAAAETFRDWSAEKTCCEALIRGGRVINRKQAEQKVKSITDPQLAALASRFANRVIALSGSAAGEQDLDYFVELFLHAVQDKRVIDGILSGSIGGHSKLLSDLDYW